MEQAGKVNITSTINIHSNQNITIIGLLHFKATQDEKTSPEDIYIRFAEEIHIGIPSHEEDEPERSEEPLRIIICMTKESSR